MSADAEVEGVAVFGTNNAATYRYVMTFKSEKLNIWLEDRSSKKQWQTGFLSKEDYVTAANTFVDASAADYISCFNECLTCSVKKTDESHRKLIFTKGGALKLEMNIKIRLLRSTRDISYIFHLKPVAVERIDVLESKLKDQQEELERLRGQMDQPNNVFSSAESATWISSKLQWNQLNSDHFQLNEDKTSITVLLPGLYVFGVLVNHTPVLGKFGSIVFQKKCKVQQRVQLTTKATVMEGLPVTHPVLRSCGQGERNSLHRVYGDFGYRQHSFVFDCSAYWDLI